MTTQEMVKMRNGGATYQEIADVCGISRQAVHRRIKNFVPPMNTYYSQDITFCSDRKCRRRGCQRHHSHANWSVKPCHSFADFKNTNYCPKNVKKKEKNDE